MPCDCPKCAAREQELTQLRAALETIRAAHHQLVTEELSLRHAYETACASEQESTAELVKANLEIARLRKVLFKVECESDEEDIIDIAKAALSESAAGQPKSMEPKASGTE